jgi:hypothetical protein
VIFRYRGERTQPEIVSGVRHDRLRLVDGELKLAKRDAELDQTILDLSPMSIFL